MTEKERTDNLLAGGDFSLLSDDNTDDAGRTQLPVFVKFIGSTTHTASDKFICVRTIGESKTATAIMTELQKMFT